MQVEKYDLSSVNAIICAAAPLSKEIQSQLFARTKVDRLGNDLWLLLVCAWLPMLRFRNGYGMSEMVAAGIVPHPDTAKRTMAKGSIGQVENTMVSQCHIYVIIVYGRLWLVWRGE